jgi:hypothetical protein
LRRSTTLIQFVKSRRNSARSASTKGSRDLGVF